MNATILIDKLENLIEIIKEKSTQNGEHSVIWKIDEERPHENILIDGIPQIIPVGIEKIKIEIMYRIDSNTDNQD